MVLKRIVRILKIVFFVGFFGIISDFEGFLEMKKKRIKGTLSSCLGSSRFFKILDEFVFLGVLY